MSSILKNKKGTKEQRKENEVKNNIYMVPKLNYCFTLSFT